jgi:hypothetical protein
MPIICAGLSDKVQHMHTHTQTTSHTTCVAPKSQVLSFPVELPANSTYIGSSTMGGDKVTTWQFAENIIGAYAEMVCITYVLIYVDRRLTSNGVANLGA